MARCNNCGRVVDGNAPYCPGCGQQNPGAGQDDAAIIAFGLVVLVLAGIFLVPAILVTWPFVGNIKDAFWACLQSGWAWVGSAVFWAIVGLLVYKAIRRRRAPTRVNMPSNVICPYCNTGLYVHEQYAGQWVNCGVCAGKFVMPNVAGS